MAAVRPAGPEPTMTTCRVEWEESGTRNRPWSVVGEALAQNKRSAEADDSPDNEVAEVHGHLVPQPDVEQRLGGSCRGEDQQGEGDDPEDRRQQAEHDRS